jgi:hypothetical protein
MPAMTWVRFMKAARRLLMAILPDKDDRRTHRTHSEGE